MWQEVSGAASGDADDMNLAPFLVCLGMCGLNVARRVSESSVDDMAERESVLYSKAFEEHGWTTTEFKKLLKHGCVKWETFGPDQLVSHGASEELLAISTGSCEVWDDERRLVREELFQGAVKDQRQAGDNHVLRATKRTVAAVWNWRVLEECLGLEPVMCAKLQRMVAASRADRLLDAYHREAGFHTTATA